MAVPRHDSNGDGQVCVNVELLYDFSQSQKDIIWNALDTWERVSNVDFSTHSITADTTMTIDVTAIDTFGRIWAYAYSWGAIEIDSNDIDRISEENFSTLVIHEVGHILGLEHQSSDSVMIPTIPSASPEPTAKDIANLETFYGQATEDTAAVVQVGGSGAQEVVGNAGPDILYGNQGTDTLYGRGGEDTLFGGQEADRLDGGDGQDILYGNRGADRLAGGDGNDTLYGGQENDTLSGGAGDDLLVGGLGADLFVTDGGNDTISDFSASHGDRLSATVTALSSGVTLIGVTTDEISFALV
jgi:hypothetical protein